MTVIRNLIVAVILTAVFGQVHAAEGQPLPPQDVFRYVIFDAGDAIEIDWAINDGAYMYDSAFAFTAANPAVILGTPELPEAKLTATSFSVNKSFIATIFLFVFRTRSMATGRSRSF